MTVIDERKAIELYLAGATLNDVAAEMEVYPTTMRRRLVAAGVEIRRGHQPPNKRTNQYEALKLRNKGWTLQQIADRFGVSRQAVHQLLNHHVTGQLHSAARRKVTCSEGHWGM